jgi:hypothetical protein
MLCSFCEKIEGKSEISGLGGGPRVGLDIEKQYVAEEESWEELYGDEWSVHLCVQLEVAVGSRKGARKR